LTYALDYFIATCERLSEHVRLITVLRDVRCIQQSLFARGGHTREEADRISLDYVAKVWEMTYWAEGLGVPVYATAYENLVDGFTSPYWEVKNLALFCGTARSPANEVLATRFIDPALCHIR
jgi:hypothetical protein